MEHPDVQAPKKRRWARCASMIGLICFLLAGGFAGGALYESHVDTSADSANPEVREDGTTYHFINPLLECDTASDLLSKLRPRLHLSEMQSTIDDIKKRGDATFVAIYYRDLNNGSWFGVNQNELFAPASLLKVPLMIYWLKQSEHDSSVLSQSVQFTQPLTGTNTQYFKTQDPVQQGKTYTITELIQRTIANSDNDAAAALAQLATKPNLEKLFDELHVDFPDGAGDTMSVVEYARFFRILFNASYLSSADSEQALQLLSQSTFNSGLTAKLPQGTVVAHKFGERVAADLPIDGVTSNERELHDCGIVYAPKDPYLLCIMTRGTDMDRQANVIADLSKDVWDRVTSRDSQ